VWQAGMEEGKTANHAFLSPLPSLGCGRGSSTTSGGAASGGGVLRKWTGLMTSWTPLLYSMGTAIALTLALCSNQCFVLRNWGGEESCFLSILLIGPKIPKRKAVYSPKR
jgi:hypothetical protein